jgi:peroxiredoxin
VGDPAPDVTLASLDDKPIKLSDFRGKPVMLNFWATWCGPCTAEMKNIEAVFQNHPEEDFVILGVNQGEGAETIKGYADLWKLNFRLVRDQGDMAARAYQVRALPTTVFIDADGNVHEIHVGGPVSVEFIEKRVSDLLAK